MVHESRVTSASHAEIDHLLEVFKDPEREGHVMLSSEAAKDILLSRLLSFYRSAKRVIRQQTDPEVEVLAAIAEHKNQGELLDYTQMLEELNIARAKEMEEDDLRTASTNLVIPEEIGKNT